MLILSFDGDSKEIQACKKYLKKAYNIVEQDNSTIELHYYSVEEQKDILRKLMEAEAAKYENLSKVYPSRERELLNRKVDLFIDLLKLYTTENS